MAETAKPESRNDRVLATVRRTPGSTIPKLYESLPFVGVENALDELQQANLVLFDEEGRVWPSDAAESVTLQPVAPKMLRWGKGTIGGGGIDSFLLRQAVRENPNAAAFEIRQLREEIAIVRAANKPTPKYNMRALAASFHSYPGDIELLPEGRGSPLPAFSQIYARNVWGKLSDAEQHVVAFLHYVWGGNTEGHREGSRIVKAKFDFGAAMSSWDDRNRAAFVAWIQEPWYM